MENKEYYSIPDGEFTIIEQKDYLKFLINSINSDIPISESNLELISNALQIVTKMEKENLFYYNPKTYTFR